MALPDPSGPAVLAARAVALVLPGDRSGLLGKRRVLCALDRFSVEVAPGEVVHLVGDAGSGVPEAIEVLSGERQPDSGQVLVDGADLLGAGRRRGAVLRARLAVVGAAPGGGGRRTVLDIVAEDLRPGDPGAPGAALTLRERAESILDSVDLPVQQRATRLQDLPPDLAGRLALARLVARRPRVVLMPPGAGWVGVPADLVAALVEGLRAAASSAIVRGSYELPVALAAHERVLVLCGGHVVEVLGPRDLGHPLHPWTRALRAGTTATASGAATGSGATAGPAGADTSGAAAGPGAGGPAHGSGPAAHRRQPRRQPAADPGCPFRGACDRAQTRCAEHMPELTTPLGASHPVACWFPEDPRAGRPAAGIVPGQTPAPEVLHTGPAPAAPPHGDEPTAHEFAEG